MKNIYFVGNAHIDPAWIWSWQEASTETKATLRSALDRMNEYPEFRFVCSASLVYEWIEEFDPAMFEEIKRRVDEGRFIIVGGWYVQADCNLPCGEGFARQGLTGQRYFKEKFGRTAKTGYSVDAFGHNLMIPQIIKKQGMEQYVFQRPHKGEMPENPHTLFRWRSPDGSEVLAHRITGGYSWLFETGEELQKAVDIHTARTEQSDKIMVFYGVGNHGGGPTKRNIELILDRAKNFSDENHIFSDVGDYFDDIRNNIDVETLPLHTGDLQRHAIGCYTASAITKDAIRSGENALLAAEIYNLLSANLLKRKYETERISEAWKGVLFCHFHDIAGGCSTESSIKGILPYLGESKSVANKIINNAIQSLSWAVDTSDSSKGVPTVVFNSLPFEVEDTVIITEAGPKAIVVRDNEGNIVASQAVVAERHLTSINPETIIRVRIPAMGYKTFYYEKAEHGTPIGEQSSGEFCVFENGMENEYLRVEFEKHSGHIISIFDKIEEREMLSGNSAVPVVYDEMGFTTWAQGKEAFDRKIAEFTDGEITVAESGPVRATIKVVNRYNKSTLTQFFSLNAGSDKLSVRAIIDWHEQHKALKLMYKTNLDNPKAYTEVPFGVAERVCDGKENHGQRFIALKDENNAMALINSNKYGSSFESDAMFMTVIRSPYFAHISYDRQKSHLSRFMEQGEHEFEYAFMKCETDSWSKVIRAAELLNRKPIPLYENNHNGYLADEFCGISVDCPNVQVSAIKRAEDADGFVIRIYETDGKETDVNITGKLLPAPLSVSIKPYEINTYRLKDGENVWREVLMTEFDI